MAIRDKIKKGNCNDVHWFQAADVRNYLWTSLRQLADMGLEPRELDLETYKVAKGLETQ